MLDLLSSCQLCPHKCKVNRLKGAKGFCKAGKDAEVYSAHLHFGEEPPISGACGSGTIFFSRCNSRCVYCQNYKFSQQGEGKKVEIDELAEIMLDLEKKGAHNINLVTPQHFIPHIIEAINICRKRGFSLPVVYNTSGYDLPETISILRGYIDIYLPDMRYSNNEMGMKYSFLPNYADYNRQAVKKMYEEVGDLVLEDGAAKKGLIIRHLVLPNNISGTRDVMKFIAEKLSKSAFISLMSQYYPVYHANRFSEISRQITEQEYQDALDAMAFFGLENGWIQESPSQKDRDVFLGENF
jgi:putative pyruvate formate lyase activating enzyme